MHSRSHEARHQVSGGALRIAIALFVGLMAMAPQISRGAGPEPTATPEELHKLFDDAQYQPLLQKLARVLQLKGEAAKAYDRVDLETLRGEAQLQMKNQAAAVSSIADAVKAINDQTTEKVAARARATQILLKHTVTFQYTPKPAAGEVPKPISVLDLTQRKAAYTALLSDMNAEVQAKSKTAKASKTLPPIIEAVRSISGMQAVELMAKDSDAESQKVADDLALQAKALMGDAVTAMSKRQKEIDDDANSLILNPSAARTTGRPNTSSTDTFHKKGLYTKTTSELKDIIDTATKVAAIAKDFAGLSKQSAAGFKEIADSADKTAKDATTTLNANYTGVQGKK